MTLPPVLAPSAPYLCHVLGLIAVTSPSQDSSLNPQLCERRHSLDPLVQGMGTLAGLGEDDATGAVQGLELVLQDLLQLA